MPHAIFHVRLFPLGNDAANVESSPDTHEAPSAFGLHVVYDATLGACITATVQHSIDGIHWVEGSNRWSFT